MGTLNLSSGVSLSATGTAFGNSAASWSNAPAGTIIQVVTGTIGETNVAQNTTATVLNNAQFTPKTSNSILLFNICWNNVTGTPSASNVARYYFGTSSTYSDNTNIATYNMNVRGTGATDIIQTSHIIRGQTTSNTSLNYFTIRITEASNSSQLVVSRHSSSSEYVIMEIAQ